ncbi:MAG: hypothetical protein JNG84_09810 [Archangium sp.]|nr:hypothetical protein [Archangium sp.]
MLQARIGATGTLFITQRVDVGLDAAVYVYDSDPNDIGYFSVVALGRTLELGNGVPVAPFLFSAKPFAAYRFKRATVKLSYQYGHFTGGAGRNHLVALRATFRITPEWRVTASLSGQADHSGSQLSNFGALATAGVLWVF